MPNTVRYSSEQVIYVRIILFEMQNITCIAKIHIKTQRIQVGNSQYVDVLFIIPVIVDIHGHRFEVFTLVSEIHENVDLVLGIKNIFELEDVLDTQSPALIF